MLTEEELYGLRGLGEQIDLEEVAEVYLPLARLIHLQVAARQRLFAATATFLGEKHPDQQVPFVIGVAGSVAVGKSTTARVLQALLARWDHHPARRPGDHGRIPVSDRPNSHRRGHHAPQRFPESYDRRKLLRFVTEVKSGAEEVAAPVYSHISYDIIPGQYHLIRQPDILIIEGLNVLQTGPRLMVSDLFDFSIYVDARIEDIENLVHPAFSRAAEHVVRRPDAHFHHYAGFSDRDATAAAKEIWNTINRPNLVENILPTRPRATLVLRKDADHTINRLRLRKL